MDCCGTQNSAFVVENSNDMRTVESNKASWCSMIIHKRPEVLLTAGTVPYQTTKGFAMFKRSGFSCCSFVRCCIDSSRRTPIPKVIGMFDGERPVFPVQPTCCNV